MLNSSGRIGRMLGSKHSFEFYSCYLLKVELLKHRDKIVKFSKLSLSEVDEVEQRIFRNIDFINEALIPIAHLKYAENLTADIDPDDAPFVALTKYIKGKIWTGDKELLKGLKNKGFTQTITTAELSVLFDELGIEY